MNANERKSENTVNLIELNRNYLKAMLCVAAKEDVRYYLEAVYFVGCEGKVLAYSTDGHQMLRWIVCEDYQGADFEYILSRRSIKDAIKTKYNIHIQASTGDLVCAKDEDFRTFKGLIDAKYPNVQKLTSEWINKIAIEQKDHLLFNANHLKNLAKIGQIIAKEYKVTNPAIRQYSRASISGIESIFTFLNVDNLMYLVTNIKHSDITENEHKAVLTDNYKPAKTNVQEFIDDGFGVLCGVSHRSVDHAKTTPADMVSVIVDYDEHGYMDANGEIWEYVYFIDAFKPDERITA